MEVLADMETITQKETPADETVILTTEVRDSLKRFIKAQSAMKGATTIGEYITTVFLAHTDYELPPTRAKGGNEVKDSK